MSTIEVLVLILAGCLVASLAVILFRGRGSGVVDALAESEQRQREAAERLAAMQAELAGRLGQLAEQNVSGQARMAEQLQVQEREVSRRLEERLADVTKRVGDTLEKTAEQAQIREREMAKQIEERLSAVTKTVGESLEKTSKQSETTIGDLKTRLAVIDAAQKNITELSTQVVGLQDILSNKQSRGQFGEIQLNDLVVQALPPSAYQFQAPLGDNKRVDCLLTLPNPPGPIAIDAKFPLESFRALNDSADETSRAAARKQLGADILVHVKAIAEKYIVPGVTAESALMFLPSESLYAELHANLGHIMQEAYKRRVWIVSPTTLMATLNTVRAVLKDARMREQAHVIQQEVDVLLKDVERLDDRVGKLDKHFGQAVEDVRQIRISTEKVSKRGERIREVEVGDDPSESAKVVEKSAAPLLGAAE